MTVYRPGLPPDVEHRWLWWRRRCTCGWTQQEGMFHGGWCSSLNYRYHLKDMAEWEERAGGKRGPFRFGTRSSAQFNEQ